MSATVPKLGRNKSKSKNSESQSSERKGEGGSSELFSHMNKDNLNYIKEQIKHKEKQKKIKENEKSKEVDEEYSPTNYKNYHAENQIQEKDSRLQETERGVNGQEQEVKEVEVVKTQTQVYKMQSKPKRQASQAAESNKISFYDLVSQAKSKRVSSLQGYLDQSNEEYKKFSFLSFLQTYINELNHHKTEKSNALKQKKGNIKSSGFKNEHDSKDTSVLLSKLKQQKGRTYILASQLQKQKKVQTSNTQKIGYLQKIVQGLVGQMNHMRRQMSQMKEQKRMEAQNMYRINRYHHNNNKVQVGNKLSHRTDDSHKVSRFLKKSKSQSEDIMQLQRQLKVFEQNGEIYLRNQNIYHHHHHHDL